MEALELLRHPGVKKLPLTFKLFIARRFGLLSASHDRIIEIRGMKYISMHTPPLGSRGFDRFVDAHVRESMGERVPEIAVISVTPQCSGECWHCLYSHEARRKEEYLDLDVLRAVAEDLADLGTYSVLLTGGDPLMHPEITEIVKLFDDRFIVNIATPGHRLSPEAARRLRSAGLAGVFIGLDSPDPGRNNRYRGVGSYDTSAAALMAAKNAGLLTGFFSVIRREQLKNGDVPHLMELAGKLGVDEVNLFEPTGPRKELLTLEERGSLAGVQEEYNRKKGYPKVISGPYMDSPLFMGCTAGFNRLFIEYNGDLRPCQLIPVQYGNVKSERLKSIWGRMQVFDRPTDRCLFFENYDILSSMGKSGGLTPEECKNICLKGEKHDIPVYYRKLGIK